MPKRKCNQKKGAKKTSKLDSKANEIAEITPRQALSMMIEDFEAQDVIDLVPRLLETVCRKYERECNKVLRQLPDKTCTPTEIYQMPLKDFIDNGGTIEQSMMSLREKKRKQFDEEATMKLEVANPDKENSNPSTKQQVDTAVDFKTPRPKTRSQATAKRKPNQLEAVKMIALSKETGSPVDERLVMETMIDDMVYGAMKNILPHISSKTAKAQATKAIEQSLTAMKKGIRQKPEVCLVTPMVTGTCGRKRKIRK